MVREIWRRYLRVLWGVYTPPPPVTSDDNIIEHGVVDFLGTQNFVIPSQKTEPL